MLGNNVAPYATAKWREAVSGTLTDRSKELWLGAVGLYVVGDTLTTVVGLNTVGASEANPALALVVAEFGLVVLLAGKLSLVLTGYVIWLRMTPRFRDSIPLLLAVCGCGITAWNLFVLSQLLV
jgi:hypothetical protein